MLPRYKNYFFPEMEGNRRFLMREVNELHLQYIL